MVDCSLLIWPVNRKPNSKNGAYIAYGDAPASLWWQDWASGESGTWTAKGQDEVTASDKAELSRRMEEARKAREAEQARIYAEAAGKAQSIYTAAQDCAEHAYLTAKGVTICHGLKVGTDSYGNKEALLIKHWKRCIRPS